MTENNDIYKSLWKKRMEIRKEYNGKYIRYLFFAIWNFKDTRTHKCGWVVLFRTSVYFTISKITLQFSYSFHVPWTILSNVFFHTSLFLFPFLFNQSQLKTDAVHQMIHPCSLKKSTIGQLNVQAATAVKEN